MAWWLTDLFILFTRPPLLNLRFTVKERGAELAVTKIQFKLNLQGSAGLPLALSNSLENLDSLRITILKDKPFWSRTCKEERPSIVRLLMEPFTMSDWIWRLSTQPGIDQARWLLRTILSQLKLGKCSLPSLKWGLNRHWQASQLMNKIFYTKLLQSRAMKVGLVGQDQSTNHSLNCGSSAKLRIVPETR
jgi:hypothetical protein